MRFFPRIWHKLVVICVAFTVPVALTTWFLLDEKRINIDLAQKERLGIEYLRPLSRLLEEVSRHRTSLRRELAGLPGAADVTEIEARVDRWFRRLEDVDRRLRQPLGTTLTALETGGRAGALPATLSEDWRQLQAGVPVVAASEALHDRLIAGLRALISHVGDTSKLIFDPDVDTYYTMEALLIREPDIIDRLNRLGDQVDVLLSQPIPGTTARIRLARDTGILEELVSGLQAGIERTFTDTERLNRNADLEPTLAPLLGLAVGSVHSLVELTARDVIDSAPVRATPAAYDAAVTRAIAANSRLWAELFNQSDVMLRTRQAGDLERQHTAVVSVGLVLVAVVLLALLLVRSISRDVGAVASAAQGLVLSARKGTEEGHQHRRGRGLRVFGHPGRPGIPEDVAVPRRRGRPPVAPHAGVASHPMLEDDGRPWPASPSSAKPGRESG